MSYYTFMPRLLNMTLTASVVICVVLVLRLFLRRAPKAISYALWFLVLFRLLCPISLQSCFSAFSLMNVPTASQGENSSVMEYIPENIVHTEYPAVTFPIPALSEIINETLPQGEEQTVADPLEVPLYIATYIWIIGVAGMLVYSLCSYLKLRRKLQIVVPLRDNIFTADDIDSPFVVGLLRPRIYLPCDLSETEQGYIILHEQFHIKRLDHVLKAVAFLALTVHWFNPLVWLAFILATKDMEMSCDEAVIAKMGSAIRADYSASLMALATGRRMIAGTPLAFGEGDTASRIKNLSKWKKPAAWIVAALTIVCVFLSVCLLTNPAAKIEGNDIEFSPGFDALSISLPYIVDEVIYESPLTSFSMVAQINTPEYMIDENMHFFSRKEYTDAPDWTDLGELSEISITKENFDKLFRNRSRDGWLGRKSASEIRKNTVRAWSVVYDREKLYYILRQSNGELYLACGYCDYYETDDIHSADSSIWLLCRIALFIHEDTSLVAISGKNAVSVVVCTVGTSPSDMKGSIRWLDIAPGPDDTVPFTISCNGYEQSGIYSIYDAETMERLDYFHPSGLSPQTYLFQNAEYGHDYIVTVQVDPGDLLCFGARIGNAVKTNTDGLTFTVTDAGTDDAEFLLTNGTDSQVEIGDYNRVLRFDGSQWITVIDHSIEPFPADSRIIYPGESCYGMAAWVREKITLEPGHYKYLFEVFLQVSDTGEKEPFVLEAEFDIK